MLANGTTTGTHERSFSIARRIKTWLRLTMTKRTINTLAILNSNRSLTDKLPILPAVTQVLSFHRRRSEVMIMKSCHIRVQDFSTSYLILSVALYLL